MLTDKSFRTEIQHHLLRRKQLESEPMIRGGAMEAYGLPMNRGRIALVGIPMILRVLLVQGKHTLIAVCLGQYAGCCYAHVLAIPLHDGGVRYIPIRLEAIAVHDNLLGANRQLVKGSMHGQYAGIEDIDLVYLLIVHNTHCPRNGIPLNDAAQLVTLLPTKLLGVVEQIIVIVGW